MSGMLAAYAISGKPDPSRHHRLRSSMSGSPSKEYWSRPEPKSPVRHARPEASTGPRRIRRPSVKSVPLTEAEDAIVAAVRMAYGVASAQVERSGRLAQRLREAGDREIGERSDRKAIDATEQLVFRAMMSALGWLEGLAAEGDSPLKRLVLAQYRILGSVLGIDPGEAVQPPPEAAMGQPEAAAARALRAIAPIHRHDHRLPRRRPATGARPPPQDDRGGSHDGEIDRYESSSIRARSSDPLKALLVFDERGHATIYLTIEPDTGRLVDRGGVPRRRPDRDRGNRAVAERLMDAADTVEFACSSEPLVREVLDEYGAFTRRGIQHYLPRDEPRSYLYEPLADYPRRGGKMLRSSLCIAMARAIGAEIEDAMPHRGRDRALAQRAPRARRHRGCERRAARHANPARALRRAAGAQRRRRDGAAEPAAAEGQHPPPRARHRAAHLRGDRAHGLGERRGPGARARLAARQSHRPRATRTTCAWCCRRPAGWRRSIRCASDA